MDQGKRSKATALLAAAALTTTAASVQAITYTEAGDAGSTLATAQATATVAGPAGTSLTSISGNLNPFTDADLYRITITSTTTFSATASSATGIDTSLFLFTSAGVPVIANDDASGTTLQGAIPAGNSFLTVLSPGIYYLGISLSGNEPINLNSQLLFTLDQPTTGVRGAASGLNPTTLGGFNAQTFFNETGAYSIALIGAATAAAVPEPSTTAALALGGIASAVLVHRFRRRQQA